MNQDIQTSHAVVAEGLGKRYGEQWALRDFDLAVPTGSVLGLLGHNGAGKTTAIRILTTLAAPTEGSATVAGHDVVTDPNGVRDQIGLTSQAATVDGLMSGFANLEMIGRLYHLPRKVAQARATRAARRAAARGRRRPPGQGLQRRHAPPARPRRQPGRLSPGPLPRRADHRARPGKPQRALGPAAPAGRRRHHPDPHHPVPGGGRPRSPTTSSCSTTARSSPPARRSQLKARHGGERVVVTVDEVDDLAAAAAGAGEGRRRRRRDRPGGPLRRRPGERSDPPDRGRAGARGRRRRRPRRAPPRGDARRRLLLPHRPARPRREPRRRPTHRPRGGGRMNANAITTAVPLPKTPAGPARLRWLVVRRLDPRQAPVLPHPPDPGEALRRDAAAADVRAAVRLRLRRRDRRPGRRRLPRISDRRDPRPDPRLRDDGPRGVDRDRPRRRASSTASARCRCRGRPT